MKLDQAAVNNSLTRNQSNGHSIITLTMLALALLFMQGQALAQTEKPINQYTYLATHNAISSYAYGYNLQNSQRYDVTM